MVYVVLKMVVNVVMIVVFKVLIVKVLVRWND